MPSCQHWLTVAGVPDPAQNSCSVMEDRFDTFIGHFSTCHAYTARDISHHGIMCLLKTTTLSTTGHYVHERRGAMYIALMPQLLSVTPSLDRLVQSSLETDM